jgi:hypothetical protein
MRTKKEIEKEIKILEEDIKENIKQYGKTYCGQDYSLIKIIALKWVLNKSRNYPVTLKETRKQIV